MAKVASTCANHTAGSAGQKDGILILTAVAATTGGSAGGSAGKSAGRSASGSAAWWVHGGHRSRGGHQCRVAKGPHPNYL